MVTHSLKEGNLPSVVGMFFRTDTDHDCFSHDRPIKFEYFPNYYMSKPTSNMCGEEGENVSRPVTKMLNDIILYLICVLFVVFIPHGVN